MRGCRRQAGTEAAEIFPRFRIGCGLVGCRVRLTTGNKEGRYHDLHTRQRSRTGIWTFRYINLEG